MPKNKMLTISKIFGWTKVYFLDGYSNYSIHPFKATNGVVEVDMDTAKLIKKLGIRGSSFKVKGTNFLVKVVEVYPYTSEVLCLKHRSYKHYCLKRDDLQLLPNHLQAIEELKVLRRDI